MKSLMIAMIVLSAASCVTAAEVTKGAIAFNVSEKDTSLVGGGTTSKLSFSLNTVIKANLSQDEVNGFGADTTIHGSFPLGPKTSFRLSDDPEYQPGNTSVKISDTVDFNQIEWKRQIIMDWSDGSLKLIARVTAKPKLANFSSVEWQDMVKSQSKHTYSEDVRVALVAENSGTEFLNVDGFMNGKIKTSNSAKPNSNGSLKVSAKQSIAGSDYSDVF